MGRSMRCEANEEVGAGAKVGGENGGSREVTAGQEKVAGDFV